VTGHGVGAILSRYRRPIIEGGMFFFTVVLADRSSELLVKHIEQLRQIYRAVQTRLPFETNAICILPDHLHAIWTLPPGDTDFALRWGQIKSGFSRELPKAQSAQLKSRSQARRRETGIWQRRFWEHAIRDDADFERHVDYIHFNPVKHGYVTRVCDWPYSSFHRYVRNALLPADWGGDLADLKGRFGE
jgi:putative transposase